METKSIKWNDFAEATNTPFMTSKSKTLFKHACAGNVKGFADVLAKYRFPGTRDYTMILVVLSVIALAKNTTDPKIKGLLKGINIREMDQLFKLMGLGKGTDIKTYFDGGHLTEYGDIFVTVLQDYGSQSPENAVKIWDAFVKQLGKMTKWTFINKKYVHDKLVPFIRGTMLGQLAETFEKAVKKGGTPEAEEPKVEPKVEEPKVEPEKTGYTLSDTDSKLAFQFVNDHCGLPPKKDERLGKIKDTIYSLAPGAHIERFFDFVKKEELDLFTKRDFMDKVKQWIDEDTKNNKRKNGEAFLAFLDLIYKRCGKKLEASDLDYYLKAGLANQRAKAMGGDDEEDEPEMEMGIFKAAAMDILEKRLEPKASDIEKEIVELAIPSYMKLAEKEGEKGADAIDSAASRGVSTIRLLRAVKDHLPAKSKGSFYNMIEVNIGKLTLAANIVRAIVACTVDDKKDGEIVEALRKVKSSNSKGFADTVKKKLEDARFVGIDNERYLNYVLDDLKYQNLSKSEEHFVREYVKNSHSLQTDELSEELLTIIKGSRVIKDKCEVWDWSKVKPATKKKVYEYAARLYADMDGVDLNLCHGILVTGHKEFWAELEKELKKA